MGRRWIFELEAAGVAVADINRALREATEAGRTEAAATLRREAESRREEEWRQGWLAGWTDSRREDIQMWRAGWRQGWLAGWTAAEAEWQRQGWHRHGQQGWRRQLRHWHGQQGWLTELE